MTHNTLRVIFGESTLQIMFCKIFELLVLKDKLEFQNENVLELKLEVACGVSRSTNKVMFTFCVSYWNSPNPSGGNVDLIVNAHACVSL